MTPQEIQRSGQIQTSLPLTASPSAASSDVKNFLAPHGLHEVRAPSPEVVNNGSRMPSPHLGCRSNSTGILKERLSQATAEYVKAKDKTDLRVSTMQQVFLAQQPELSDEAAKAQAENLLKHELSEVEKLKKEVDELQLKSQVVDEVELRNQIVVSPEVTNGLVSASEMARLETKALLGEVSSNAQAALREKMPSIYESAIKETLSESFHALNVKVELDTATGLRRLFNKFLSWIGVTRFVRLPDTALQLGKGRIDEELSSKNIDLIYKSIVPKANQQQVRELTPNEISQYNSLFKTLGLVHDENGMTQFDSPELKAELSRRYPNSADSLVALYREMNHKLEKKVFEKRVAVANEVYQKDAKTYQAKATKLAGEGSEFQELKEMLTEKWKDDMLSSQANKLQ